MKKLTEVEIEEKLYNFHIKISNLGQLSTAFYLEDIFNTWVHYNHMIMQLRKVIFELQLAAAVLDPKREDCGYPYKELCG